MEFGHSYTLTGIALHKMVNSERSEPLANTSVSYSTICINGTISFCCLQSVLIFPFPIKRLKKWWKCFSPFSIFIFNLQSFKIYNILLKYNMHLKIWKLTCKNTIYVKAQYTFKILNIHKLYRKTSYTSIYLYCTYERGRIRKRERK